MDIAQENKKIQPQAKDLTTTGPLVMLQAELSSGLRLYWEKAGGILKGSGIRLLDPADDFFSLERNFFSALFLYSYYRAGIAEPHRIVYTAINQCLRGMVTGCDNLLDDEYKQTLPTDLPAQGIRFRSVLDIMVSDRVLFEILLHGFSDNEYDHGEVLAASAASLHALTRSGAQEASEEGGIHSILRPEQILQSIHHYKTGLLFQCPWAVPLIIEDSRPESVSVLLEALYQIGMGCQVMDDMVDLAGDLRKKRHNYVIAIIYHDSDRNEWNRLNAVMASNPGIKAEKNLLLELPRAHSLAVKSARTFLAKGLGALFESIRPSLVEPCLAFLAKRIGTEHMMFDME
jgi:geranylgeranyl pyrophosphate synthase